MEEDAELNRLIALREKARTETKDYTSQIQRRRAKIRRKVKKDGKWHADERLFHSPLFRITKLKEKKKVIVDMFDSLFNKIQGFHRSNDHVRRMRARVELEEVTYEVETVTDPETGKSVRAS